MNLSSYDHHINHIVRVVMNSGELVERSGSRFKLFSDFAELVEREKKRQTSSLVRCDIHQEPNFETRDKCKHMQVDGRVEALLALFGLLRSAWAADLSCVLVSACSTLAAVTSLRDKASLGCRLRNTSTMTTA